MTGDYPTIGIAVMGYLGTHPNRCGFVRCGYTEYYNEGEVKYYGYSDKNDYTEKKGSYISYKK